MKPIALVLSLSGLAAFCASAPAATPVVLPMVGPANVSAAKTEASGGLTVYSGYDANVANTDNDKPRQNSAYEICTADGKRLQTVPNNYGTTAGDRPVVIQLAAGEYRINAWSAKQGLVTVPVKIVGGRMTTLRLDEKS